MQIKKNLNKIYKFLIIVFLFIASIVAMVFGSIDVGKNNTQMGAFGDSYHMSYKIDLSNATTVEEKTKLLEDTSKSFSNWLINQNINTNGVKYEIKDDGYGYIYTDRYNVSKIEYQGDENVDQDPTFIALDSISSSRIEIQQFNPDVQDKGIPSDNLKPYTTNNERYTSVITQENINLSSVQKDSKDTLATDSTKINYGVEFTLNTDPLDIEKFNEQKENSSENKLEWIVFQNLDGLLLKLRYAKYLALVNNGTPTSNDIFRFNTLPTTLQTWAKASIANGNKDQITRNNILHFYEMAVSNSSSDSSTASASVKATTTNPNGDASLKTIVDEYILGTITYENYNDWFPGSTVIGSTNSGDDNNTETDGGETKSLSSNNTNTRAGGTKYVTKVSIQKPTNEIEQQSLVNRIKNMTFSAPLYVDQTTDPSKETQFNNIAWINQSYLTSSSIKSLTAYESTMLALGATLLLIAIIVSILYRIPGIFGSFAIVASTIFSASLLVVLNINFSISTIVGLLVGIVCTSISVSLFVERMRKSFRDKNSVFDSLMNTFRKSLFSILDINVIPLLIGLGLVFVGKGEIIDFGLVLVLVSLVSFASIMLLYIFPNFLIKDNTWLWNPKFYTSFNARKVKDYNVAKINKFNSSYRKIIFPIFLIVGILLFIVGISLVFTIGVQNSSYYNTGTNLLINANSLVDKTLDVNQILAALPGGKWEYIGVTNNVYQFSTIGVYSSIDVSNSLANINGITSSVLTVAKSDPTYAIDISKSAVYAILLGYGFVSIYAVFRLNILSVIPWFISSCIGVIAPVSFIYLVWIPIDSWFVYAAIFISIVASVVSFVYVSITKTRFNKRQISKFNELTGFITLNIIHIKNLMYVLMGIIITISVVFMIFGSTSMLWLFVYILIGSLISIVFSYFIIPFLYFVSLYIRQKYVKNIVSNVDKRINVHTENDVDEELIEGINKFH